VIVSGFRRLNKNKNYRDIALIMIIVALVFIVSIVIGVNLSKHSKDEHSSNFSTDSSSDDKLFDISGSYILNNIDGMWISNLSADLNTTSFKF
jgi:hypothetical protein